MMMKIMNDTGLSVLDERVFTLYDLFEITVKKNVSRPAICFKSEFNSGFISYHDLSSECQRVSRLLEDSGVKYGYIGIYLKQLSVSVAPIVILGILKTNLAFVCLNVQHEPWELHVVKHLNIRWIFTDTKLENKNWFSRKTITVFNKLLTLYENVSDKEVLDNCNKGEWIMAYAIGTSGTTGQPKIVKVPHQCIVPNIQELKHLLSVVPNDVIFLSAPLTFDPSIIEMFLALTSGACLLIVPDYIQMPLPLLLEMLRSVTIMEATPSFIKRWSKKEINKTLLHKESSLRVLLLGGEPCPTKDILKYWKMNGNRTQLYNIYGITEVSCWASIYKIILNEDKDIDINEELKIPLGDALSFTTLKVKDNLGNEIVDGEGELFVGSMTRVCLLDNETIQDLEFPVFRATGDIVQINSSNGKLYYLGRNNNVFKRFGNRVSLDKVNETSNSHNEVAQSCCIWNEQLSRLCLFLVVDNNSSNYNNFEEEFRKYLLKKLNLSHIPDAIIIVKSLPLTSHGKIDIGKLENIIKRKTNCNIERCCEIGNVINCFTLLWSQYLSLRSPPNPDDNFVQNGGSSIFALNLVSDLNEMLGTFRSDGLISYLLGHYTFNDCCNYLLSKQNESLSFGQPETSCNTTALVVDPCIFVQKRKSTDSVIDHSHSNKRINSNNTSYSNQNRNKSKLLFSICRGRIEIGDAQQLPLCEMLVGVPFDVRIKWTFDLGKCIDASPRFLLYENNKEIIYIGSHSSVFMGINASNRELIFSCNLKNRIESSMCSSPCGEIGVVGCYDGLIYGISLESGDIIWKFKTGQMVKSSAALCLNGSAVVIGSYDHHLYCINILKGHLIWSCKVSDGSIYASPCVSAINKSVFVASLDGTCAAVNECDGTFIWKNKLKSPVFSSPGIMSEESVVIFAEVLGLVSFFSAITGEKLWTFQAGGNIFSSFSIQSSSESNIILFGCHDQYVYCLINSINSIILNWKCKLDSAVFATPCIFPTKQGEECKSYKAVVASISGMIYIIDTMCGEKLFSLNLPGEVFSSPVVYEHQIFIGCRDNKLYCLYIECRGSKIVNVTEETLKKSGSALLKEI